MAQVIPLPPFPLISRLDTDSFIDNLYKEIDKIREGRASGTSNDAPKPRDSRMDEDRKVSDDEKREDVDFLYDSDGSDEEDNPRRLNTKPHNEDSNAFDKQPSIPSINQSANSDTKATAGHLKPPPPAPPRLDPSGNDTNRYDLRHKH